MLAELNLRSFHSTALQRNEPEQKQNQMGSKHNSDVTLETVTLFPVILIGTRDRLMRISASIS